MTYFNCSGCGALVEVGTLEKKGISHWCPKCGAPLSEGSVRQAKEIANTEKQGGGCALVLLGVGATATGVGAIVGIPMLLVGLSILFGTTKVAGCLLLFASVVFCLLFGVGMFVALFPAENDTATAAIGGPIGGIAISLLVFAFPAILTGAAGLVLVRSSWRDATITKIRSLVRRS